MKNGIHIYKVSRGGTKLIINHISLNNYYHTVIILALPVNEYLMSDIGGMYDIGY